jgi:hypothetical protein
MTRLDDARRAKLRSIVAEIGVYRVAREFGSSDNTIEEAMTGGLVRNHVVERLSKLIDQAGGEES